MTKLAHENEDKLLFTPGPLTTSPGVKEAMLRDLGSRDREFIEKVRSIRRRLLALGEVAEPSFVAIPMQGSGTFGIESVIGTAIPERGKLLVASNGAYGQRIAHIARALRIDHTIQEYPEEQRVDPSRIDTALERDPSITTVAVVHCETSTGIMNPIEAIGPRVAARKRTFVVDAMSSFGAVPIALGPSGIDYLVSSANKCIEGVPGFSFVLARRAALETTEGQARSLSLDLFSQWRGLEQSGQFRFTPPTHALLAFDRALTELDAEGGVAGRASRYRENHETLMRGMRALGFRAFLPPEAQGYIITPFFNPTHPRYDFEQLYARLSDRGFVIYPGKVSKSDCFRIGTIGRLDAADVARLLEAIAAVLGDMGVPTPLAAT